jgi:SNF2 family DNA or RNA helicase
MPGYLFSHSTFVEKLEKPMIKSKSQEAGEQLRRLVQPFMLRRLKQDVLKELPPKIEYTRLIQLSETERKTYLSAVYAAKNSLGESKFQILAALTQLRQVCCDPNLCFENYQGETSKLEACLELCAGMVENGHQILLFSQFTSMLSRIRQRLEEMGISSFTLEGATPKKKRAELVKAFNAGGASVFLISLKAGGTGLNLTAADVVIHYDPWWNIAAQNQATDRAHRIGQSAHVQVYKLIAKDTIEEKILELQEKKANLLDAVSGAAGGSILDMTKEELLQLLD